LQIHRIVFNHSSVAILTLTKSIVFTKQHSVVLTLFRNCSGLDAACKTSGIKLFVGELCGHCTFSAICSLHSGTIELRMRCVQSPILLSLPRQQSSTSFTAFSFCLTSLFSGVYFWLLWVP